MAHQHVYLVQDGVFALSSLKVRERENMGLIAKVISFVHPRTGEATKFMMVGDNLLELQVARPREPQELASFFVDQAVQQEGAVHTASRIDPLFLLLPVLAKHATRWCPLDQALAEGGCGSLRGLRHLDANKLCDVNDRMGPDDLLIRINEDSVLSWLSGKVERATTRFMDLATKDGAQAESGWAAGGGASGEGYAGDFQTIATPIDARRRKEVEAECKNLALEAVCEYLGDDWATKLAEKFSTERAILFGGKSSAPKKRKAVWEESAETDRNLELSHGSGGGLKTKAEAVAAAAKAKQPISHAQRSLAKVNKKGMKSISSFFGKK
ncbi:unnamed protein product [Scytosiphon promiscuus]